MTIKKIGHCSMVVEENGVRFLVDPGSFTPEQAEEKDIDAILITHEHGDHFHLDSIRQVLANNPACQIVTNSAVGKLLQAESLEHILVDDGKSADIKGVPIAGFGRKHAVVYEEYGQVENTGLYIAEKLFFPGDAFYDPRLATMDILALPIAGPWMKISEALDYARAVKPRVCFGVHDGILNPNLGGLMAAMPKQILEKYDIRFEPMRAGDQKEF